MPSKQDLDIAIIGGGIAGLTLGIGLYRRGISVHIYEAAHHFGEIGAGLAFTPNAIQAMDILDKDIFAGFERVRTRNAWPSKQKVWFDFYDCSTHDGRTDIAQHRFPSTSSLGQNGVDRAHFLDEMIKLFPTEQVPFGKRLESYSQVEDGLFELAFADGSTTTAHAIIGCDGIKSHVRSSLFSHDHPCAAPTYTGVYAYRALVPMEKALEVVGEERASNASFYLAPDQHVLTVAIDHDTILSLNAFNRDSKDWPDHIKLTAPATREDMLQQFAGCTRDIKRLLSLAEPELDVWAIFDLGTRPPPTFSRGRVCLVGDVAHATSPHHGAGAGMCIEDAAILAELLADEKVTSYQDVEKAFAVYDKIRRPRGEFLVQSSRYMGEAYDWRIEGDGDIFETVEAELDRRNGQIHNLDVAAMCKEAREQLSSM